MRPRLCMYCGSGGPWIYHEGTRGDEPGLGRFYCQACGTFLGRATVEVDLEDPDPKEMRRMKKFRWRRRRKERGLSTK